jgi:hypothetical protein
LSFVSPAAVGGGAPAGSGGANEGGDALVTERAFLEIEFLQHYSSTGSRRKAGARATSQLRVADAVVQPEDLETRQGASAQGGGECRGACVAHMHIHDSKRGHGRKRTRAQPLRQPLHAVGAGCAC